MKYYVLLFITHTSEKLFKKNRLNTLCSLYLHNLSKQHNNIARPGSVYFKFSITIAICSGLKTS